MILDNLDDMEFTLSCSEIRFPDQRYRYCPQIKLYIREQGHFKLYDQTEVVKGITSPIFKQKLKIPCSSGVALGLKFELVDSSSADDEKFLGQAVITSEELLRVSSERTKSVEIINLTYKVCDLTLKGSPSLNPSKNLLITIEGVDLKYHTTWFAKPEMRPFFRLGRWMADEEYLYVYESSPVEEPRNPKWRSFKIRSSYLCKGDFKSPIKLLVLHYENGVEKILGEGMFNLEQIVYDQASVVLEDKVKQKSIGTIKIRGQTLEKITSLVENKFDSKLNVVLGLDFSDTQKRILGFDSTHSKGYSSDLNQYQEAVNELFSLFLEMNGKQGIPSYGFGGLKTSVCSKFRKTTSPSCFSITENVSNPCISSLSEMTDAYNKCLAHHMLGGQANFSEVIQKATYLATFNQLRGSQEYVVLILLTDGTIQDPENTLNSIIQAANAPLSIIMIGIGESDMESFETLDNQLGLYETARRDYVSFFAYKDFEKDITKLKTKILQEIPQQILEYVETEHSLYEESKIRHKEIPLYLKEDLYKSGREYSKARKQLEGFIRRPIK